jgi:hypothetical protein
MFKDKWIDIHYPLQGEKLEVSFNIPQRSVETISFHDAIDDAAKEIAKKHNDIFIPLTGGQDSELCCNVFLRNGIPFTPVIFMTPYNLQEVKYAIQYSENLSLKTKYLYFYDEFKFNQEVLPRFIEFLGRIKRIRWFNVSPYVISTFLPGTYITGTMDPWSFNWCENHNKGIYDNTPQTYNEDLYLYDYDFYTAKECDNFYAPLAYTPEVFFNMIREMDFSFNCVAAKAKLYRVPERKKIDVTVDEESKIYKFSRVILRNKLVAGGYDVGQIQSFIGSKSDLLEKYMK